MGPVEIAIVAAGGACLALLMWPRLAKAALWRATITPLASIIGSGFLILGPILVDSFGSWAVAAMAVLCLAGYLFGAAIRYNIASLGTEFRCRTPASRRNDDLMERVASWALAFAYFVSVAYYLNLFGAFAARIFGAPSDLLARLITTGAYGAILLAGLGRGFGLLERLEQVTVSVKLVVIAALIAALAVHVGIEVEGGGVPQDGPRLGGWDAVRLMFGLIVTVQGFETSRYLGDHYDAGQRRRSMQLAQWLSSGIYIAYVALLALSFRAGAFPAQETAVIDMMTTVAAVLGPLLILAALSAQFSAAVADTGGSGGLVDELTHGRLGARATYGALAATGLVLTWLFDVFEIVSYASRAFALYYALQSCLAALRARDDGRGPLRIAGFAALGGLGLAAAALGTPVEG